MKNKLIRAVPVILCVLSLLTIAAVIISGTADGIQNRQLSDGSETTEEILNVPSVIIFEFEPETEALTEATTVMATEPLTQPETTEVLPFPVTEPLTEDTTEAVSKVKSLPSDLLLSNNAALAKADGTILAVKNAEERIFPASITKVMTLILTYENVEDLDNTFTMTQSIINKMWAAGAAKAGFSAGETVTIRDLIYASALPSGGDAALALALYIGGSEEEFARLMNEKAAELGMTDTHFVNPIGLHDENHYSTVIDLVKLMSYALCNDDLRNVLSTRRYVTSVTPEHPSGITLYSSVFTRIAYYQPKGATILGGKTGYTPEAGDCLASFASSSDGEDYIFVSVKAPDTYDVASDAQFVYSNLSAYIY